MALDILFLPTTGIPLYKITLDNIECDTATQQQTWTYTVTELGSGQDISNWALQMCSNIRVLTTNPVTTEIGKPGGGQGNCLNGQNECSKVDYQIKWDNLSPSFTSGQFSFTLDGCHKCRKVLTAIKAGKPCFCGMILGPCCDPTSSECNDCCPPPPTRGILFI